MSGQAPVGTTSSSSVDLTSPGFIALWTILGALVLAALATAIYYAVKSANAKKGNDNLLRGQELALQHLQDSGFRVL